MGAVLEYRGALEGGIEMSTVDIVERLQRIVGEALAQARQSAVGQAPEPDAETTTLRILKELGDAVRTDHDFRQEVEASLGPMAPADSNG